MLKNLTMEIDSEVKDQNSFLERMGAGFTGAGDALGKTMSALDDMTKRAGGRVAAAIVVGIIALFLLTYFATKKLGKASP